MYVMDYAILFDGFPVCGEFRWLAQCLNVVMFRVSVLMHSVLEVPRKFCKVWRVRMMPCCVDSHNFVDPNDNVGLCHVSDGYPGWFLECDSGR